MNEVVGRGTVLAGRYRVLEPGPTDLPGSSLWQGTDQILDRPVRVRLLEQGDVTQALDAARRAALVTDARLVRVLDVGMHEDTGYVVTEQVAGPSLEQLLARGPLSADQARALVGEVSSALEVARRRGVHHLTLRPSSVHVAPDGRVLVTGLALDGALLGLAGGDARSTSRADAVALVRLLYTALTGLWPTGGHLPGTPAALPEAPTSEQGPVPPADLVADVPNDLDTLCAVTLGPHVDGPHSPGEVVRELEPWGSIRTVGLTQAAESAAAPGQAWPIVGAAVAAGAASAAPGGRDTDTEPDYDDGPPTEAFTPPQIQRQSVRTAFADQTPPGANLPGTPPPAAPSRTSAFGPTGALGAGAAAARPVAPPPTPAAPPAGPSMTPPGGPTVPLGAVGAGTPGGPGAPVPPAQPLTTGAAAQTPPAAATPVPPARSSAFGAAAAPGPSVTPAPAPQAAPAPVPPAFAPGGSTGARPGGPSEQVEWDDFGIEEQRQTRRRSDPTAIVLGIVAVVVLVGVVLAFRALFAGGDGGDTPAAESSTSQQASASPEPSTATDGATTPSTPSGAAPVIASIQSVDPSDGDGEHQEAVDRAFDGDPSTFWYTMTYKRDDFAGFKPGVALVLNLQEQSTVSAVKLQVNGAGGNVQVRQTDAANPSGGTLLAEGPLGPETVLTFDAPVDTQSIVLWFDHLPTAPDGGFRIELAEITLS